MAIGVASSLFPATMRYDVATFFRRRHLYVNEALYIKKKSFFTVIIPFSFCI